MWRLLHKGLEHHKRLRDTPFKRIVYFCALVHIFFLFGACFVQMDDHMHVMVQGASDARIVCLPSFMLPPQRSRMRNKKKKQRRPKPVQKKQKKLNPKKQKPEKVAARKKAKSTIQETEKNLPKKQKQLQKEIIEQEIEVEDEITPVATPGEQLPEQQTELPDEESDIIYVNRETYEILEVGRILQEAIGVHWAPPAGMPAQTKCLIRVNVDRQGKPTAIDVLEKSGVAVFDMAARSAVRAAEYPQSVWGKTMVVHFNEEFA